MQLSSIGLGGYGLAFSGVCWYNYTKIKAMKAKQEAQQQQPAEMESLKPKEAGKLQA